jgi:hypothetical protein
VPDGGGSISSSTRVDATEEGKVLVRIVAQGKGYRVADFEEDVFELDEHGEAVRPKALSATPDGNLAHEDPPR